MSKIYTAEQLEELQYSDEYADFIMNNSHAERLICSGKMLTAAMEDGFLFDRFLKSLDK